MVAMKLPGHSVGRNLLKIRLGRSCWRAKIESAKGQSRRLAIPGRGKQESRIDLTRRCCSDSGIPACDTMLHVSVRWVRLSQRLAGNLRPSLAGPALYCSPLKIIWCNYPRNSSAQACAHLTVACAISLSCHVLSPVRQSHELGAL